MKSFKLFLDQITEAAKKKKPDYLDIDGDGVTTEPMKDAADDMKDAADDKEKNKKDNKNDDKKDK